MSSVNHQLINVRDSQTQCENMDLFTVCVIVVVRMLPHFGPWGTVNSSRPNSRLDQLGYARRTVRASPGAKARRDSRQRIWYESGIC
jgi:hypothetical protein